MYYINIALLYLGMKFNAQMVSEIVFFLKRITNQTLKCYRLVYCIYVNICETHFVKNYTKICLLICINFQAYLYLLIMYYLATSFMIFKLTHLGRYVLYYSYIKSSFCLMV